MREFLCPKCNISKNENEYDVLDPTKSFPLISTCKQCSDEFLIEKIDCRCSKCMKKLPPEYFQHYRTRIKANGMRLRVNTNCSECSKKTSKVLRKIKNDIKEKYPMPDYGTRCSQCNKIVYEKVEDIPEGIDGTNGPWQTDHDHLTDKFRGYTCKLCNTGTGMIGDDYQYWDNAKKRKSGN